MAAFVLVICIFIADTILHLHFQKTRPDDGIDHLPCAVTKVFLIPTLYLGLFLASGAFARPLQNPDVVLFIAVCYWLGDVLLIFKGHFVFYIGVVAFMLGHVGYILYFRAFGFCLPALVIAIVVSAAFYAHYCLVIVKRKPALMAGFLLYGFMILAFAVGMASFFSYGHVRSSILALCGVAAFAYSDSRIAYNMAGYRKTSDLVIMSTYILANVLLASAIWCINA